MAPCSIVANIQKEAVMLKLFILFPVTPRLAQGFAVCIKLGDDSVSLVIVIYWEGVLVMIVGYWELDSLSSYVMTNGYKEVKCGESVEITLKSVITCCWDVLSDNTYDWL